MCITAFWTRSYAADVSIYAGVNINYYNDDVNGFFFSSSLFLLVYAKRVQSFHRAETRPLGKWEKKTNNAHIIIYAYPGRFGEYIFVCVCVFVYIIIIFWLKAFWMWKKKKKASVCVLCAYYQVSTARKKPGWTARGVCACGYFFFF